MKNTEFSPYQRSQGNRQEQLEKIREIIRNELTDAQREILIAYYFQMSTIPEIAAQRGVNKSTVSRTLHRGEERIRRYLRY